MRDLHPVPGILAPDPNSSRLTLGALAGRVYWQPMDEWKHGLSLVARSALTPERCDRLGLHLPESRIVPEQPGVRAAIAALPGLAVSESLRETLEAEGCPVCTAHYTRVSGTLTITASGWGTPAVRLSGMLYDWLPGSTLECIDRILAAATGGVLGELAVRGADWAGKHIDPLLVDDRRRAEALARQAEAATLRAELVESMGAELAAEVFGETSRAVLRLDGLEATLQRPADPEAAREAAADILAGRRDAVSVGGRWYAVSRRPAAVVRGLHVPPAVVARYGST